MEKQIVIFISALAMVFLATLTLFSMTIAPVCSGFMQYAGIYKIASLTIFVVAYVFFVAIKRSGTAAVLIPIAQAIVGFLFANYLNSLPMNCVD